MSGIVATGGEKKEFERPEAGTYGARCIHIVDLGTHDKEWQGKVSKRHQVLLVFEIDSEMEGKYDEQYKGKRFVVNWKGTLSIGENAHLRRHLESWRGKKFTKEEAKGFDLKNILDKPCVLSLVESEWKDKTYINIETISPPMKGMKIPDAENDLVFFPITDIETGDWEKLWPWEQKIIMESDEGKAFTAGGEPFTSPEESGESEDGDEPVPF